MPEFHDFIKRHLVPSGDSVSLSKLETRTKGPFDDKDEAIAFTEKTVAEIQRLQYRMYVEGKQSLLIVLQAPDAAGKDGLIRHVLGKMNPQGCRTYPFKKPTREELSHDFLWRIHQATPAAGMVSIFNRSHYEDVLIVRVEELVEKAIWKERYEMINSFESLLASSQTTILKIYLHISPEEQLERFGERLSRPEKHWKLNAGDYQVRRQWSDYAKAYEDAIEKCNFDHAPWFVIPADRKWYRNAAVAGIVAATLEKMNPQFPPVEADLNEIETLYREEVEAAARRD